MSEIVQHLKDLARWGHGIAWHPVYKQYWPFSVNDESISWWDDPGGITGDNYEMVVERLYYEIQPKEFRKHLELASKIVKGWPEWKRTLLGGKP